KEAALSLVFHPHHLMRLSSFIKGALQMGTERLSRRRFLAWSGVVAGSAALAACAAPSAPGAAPESGAQQAEPSAAGASLVGWLNIGFLPENTETEQPYRDAVLAHW